MIPHVIEHIAHEEDLRRLAVRLSEPSSLAIDIETTDWWSRDQERISVVQIAFREKSTIVVAIIDLLAPVSLDPLRRTLEQSLQTKVMHNASFDAVRLARHCRIATSPIHDTMIAARRAGEKGCSLKALVERHLGIRLAKEEQRSDWSRRPLSDSQVRYAALDAASTLLLYEKQRSFGLAGNYQIPTTLLRREDQRVAPETTATPLTASPLTASPLTASPLTAGSPAESYESGELEQALLAIVALFPGRYSPLQLVVLTSGERSGQAGWIIDCQLGTEATIDEKVASETISRLCDHGRLAVDADGRLHTSGIPPS